jgi:hypothetical protein
VRIPISAVLQLTRSDPRIKHRYKAFRASILAIEGNDSENQLEPFSPVSPGF